MNITHGLIIVDNKGMILCVHPTGSNANTWSIPKGGADKGETSLQAAIRELEEETSFKMGYYLNDVIYYENIGQFPYRNNKKTLHAHVYMINKPLSEMNLKLECQSLIDGSDKLECDIIEWKNLNEAIVLLHITQTMALMDIRKKILEKKEN